MFKFQAGGEELWSMLAANTDLNYMPFKLAEQPAYMMFDISFHCNTQKDRELN